MDKLQDNILSNFQISLGHPPFFAPISELDAVGPVLQPSVLRCKGYRTGEKTYICVSLARLPLSPNLPSVAFDVFSLTTLVVLGELHGTADVELNVS